MAFPTFSPHLDELLRHQEFVRRLAARLVSDEQGAEDLAQDVWVAALARRPRGLASARAWLSRVTRNLAAKRARGERHRRGRETRAAEDPPASSVDAVSSEFELQHRVADAVHRLDEPYRSTILLRYFKELSHREIAERTGVPIATVRTRLQRGVARLRDRLDREHDGDREGWIRGLVLLFGKDLLAPAVPVTGGLLTTGVTMGVLAKVAVGIAIAASAAWWVWTPEEEAPPEGEVAVMAAASPLGHLDDGGSGLAEVEVEPIRTEVEGAASTPLAESFVRPESSLTRGWVVLGRAHGLEEGEGAAARVTVSGFNDYAWPDELNVTEGIAPDGTFEVDVTRLVLLEGRVRTPLRALRILVDHPLCRQQEERLEATPEHRVMGGLEDLDEPITWWVDVHLRPAAAITGRVEFSDGTPAAGAAVGAWSMVDGEPGPNRGDDTTCDELGAFRLRLADPGEYVVGAAHQRWRPAHRVTVAEMNRTTDLDDPLVLEAGEVLSGQLSRFGEPMGGVDISVRLLGVRRACDLHPTWAIRYFLGWCEESMEHLRAATVTGEAGEWEITGLASGLYQVHVGSPPEHRLGLGGDYSWIEVRAPARGLQLACSGSSIRFECEEELGAIEEGSLTVYFEGRRARGVEFQGMHGIPSIWGVPGDRREVEVQFEGRETWRDEVVFPPAGGDLAIPVSLPLGSEPASLQLAVEIAGDDSVTHLELDLFVSTEDETTPSSRLRAQLVDGVAIFAPISSGRYRGVLRSESYFTYLQEVDLEFDLAPEEVLERSVAFELGGRIGLIVRDPDGRELPAMVTLRDAAGAARDVMFVALTDRGRYVSEDRLVLPVINETYPCLPPGEYEVQVEHAGFASQVHTVRVDAGVTTPLALVLTRE